MVFEKTLLERTNAKIILDAPMKNRTTLGVGGRAKYLVEADSLYSIRETIELAKEQNLPFKVIGLGSNVLVSDLGFNGVVISMLRLNDVYFKVNQVRAMAGATISKLVKFATENGLTGLEALSGIPGTVGGAVVMNAGAFGHTISDYITEVETISNGKIRKYYKGECGFKYRNSKFRTNNEVVVSATFDLKEKGIEQVRGANQSYKELRESLQPKGRSCGSVFLNPKNKSAGDLIERTGLKGLTFGGATISIKHANFIITNQAATATDVYHLIKHVKDKVKEKFNVELKEEVEFLGEF